MLRYLSNAIGILKKVILFSFSYSQFLYKMYITSSIVWKKTYLKFLIGSNIFVMREETKYNINQRSGPGCSKRR